MFASAASLRSPWRRLAAGCAALAVALVAVRGAAQVTGGGALDPTSPALDDRFSIARVKYTGGGDWYNDPSAETDLLRELARRTRAHVAVEKHVVSLSDAELFSYPMLYLTGHGKITATDREVERLRRYLEAGGFLYADDDYGMDDSFRQLIARLYPDKPLVELPFSHPIYHAVYDFPHGLPKTHEHYPGPPKGYGLFVRGRLAVFYTYNSNITDGWTSAHNDPAPKREEAFRMGVNIAWYALTSRS